jgi:hypothetical protein
MTNSIQPKQQTDIELWQNIFEQAIEQTRQELGYDIPIGKLRVNPDNLREDEQQAIKLFDETMHEYCIEQWTQQVELARRYLALVVESKERRALAWLNLKSIDEIAQAGLQIADSMPESGTKRQIQSFYRNHLPALDRAGIDMQDVNALMAEPDKTIFETSRAISRVEKSDLTEPERNDKIQEIVNDAITIPAADLRRKWINGQVHVPRDEYYCQREKTKLITFVCDEHNPEQESTIRRLTDDISDIYGNALPIIDSVKDERIKHDVLQQLTIALAIIQSKDLDALSTVDKQIVNVLKEYDLC